MLPLGAGGLRGGLTTRELHSAAVYGDVCHMSCNRCMSAGVSFAFMMYVRASMTMCCCRCLSNAAAVNGISSCLNIAI